VRDYVAEALGDEGGVLVVDETGFLKKGTHSVGVARQDSGTAGRVENCQVGVFAAYASRWDQALVDRRLYLPRGWAEDDARRAKAQVPEETAFATKPAIAGAMMAELLGAGLPVRWVLADALYGSDAPMRWMLEERGQPYVLAVRSNQSVKFLEGWLPVLTDPAAMAAAIPDEDCHTLAAGEGFERWLLIQRSRHDPEAMAYYFAYAPAGTSLAELAGAAGLRWSIEQAFQHTKDDLGLDHCEARSWHGWHRHTTLVMAAAAYLAKLSADRRRHAFGKEDKTSPSVAAAA
jgi:SRSO17 transposase